MKSLASHAPVALVASAGAFLIAAVVTLIVMGFRDLAPAIVLVVIALLWTIAFVVVALKSGEIKLPAFLERDAVRASEVEARIQAGVEERIHAAVEAAVTDVRRGFALKDQRHRAAVIEALVAKREHTAVVEAAKAASDEPQDVGARSAPPSGQSDRSLPHEESHVSEALNTTPEAYRPRETAAASPAPTAKTVVGEFADFLVSELNANKAQIEGELQKGEASLETLAENSLTSLFPANGVLAFAKPIIQGGIKTYVSNLVAQYGPAVLFALGEAEAQQIATSLGG